MSYKIVIVLLLLFSLDGIECLSRGLRRCLAELSSLIDLCSQVVGGGEYVSPTGGQGGGNSSLSRDIKNLTLEDKLELVRTQLEEVSRVQGEVKEMRTRIAEVCRALA